MKKVVAVALGLFVANVVTTVAIAAPPVRTDAAKPASPTQKNASAESKAKQAKALHAQAYALYKKKQYLTAIPLIDHAIALQPENVDFWTFKSYLHGKAQQYPQSLAAAEQIVKLDPDSAEGYSVRGTAKYFLKYKPADILDDYRKAYALDYRSTNFYSNYLDLLKDEKLYDEVKDVYANYEGLRRDDPESLDEENSDVPFYAGVAYFNTGDFRRAVELYSEAIRISPNFSGYYVNRGGAYDELEEYTKALDDYARAIQWEPKNANAFYNRGVTFMTLERYEEALRDFRQANKLGQNDVNIWLNIGAAANHLDRHEEALAAYDNALKIDPKDGRVLSNRANVLRDLGRPTEAAQAAATAMPLLKSDKQATLLFNQTTSLMAEKNYEKAVGLLTQAVALDPALSQAWGRLSHAYYMMGDLQNALKATNEGIRVAPDVPEHYLNRGLIYTKSGQAERGLQDYRTAERLRPGDVNAMVRIALAYKEAGNGDDAMRIYEALAKTNPTLVDFYINYSALLLDRSENLRALTVTKRGIAQHPEDYNLLVNHANALSENKDFDGAIAAYHRAMKIGPTNVSAPYNLANLYMVDMEKPASAIEWYEKAIQIAPTEFAAYLNLASAYKDSGNVDAALKTLGDAVTRFPERYEAAFNRAGMLNQIGRNSEAQRDYALALKRIDGLLPKDDLQPNDDQLEIMGYQAFIMYRIGRTREAAPLMARVVALSPDAVEFRRNYGYMLLDLQRPEEASREFARAFAADPNEVDSWIGMMASTYLNGDRAALVKQKQQFMARFGAKYPLDLTLLPTLMKDVYWYTDSFQKIWRNVIAAPN